MLFDSKAKKWAWAVFLPVSACALYFFYGPMRIRVEQCPYCGAQLRTTTHAGVVTQRSFEATHAYRWISRVRPEHREHDWRIMAWIDRTWSGDYETVDQSEGMLLGLAMYHRVLGPNESSRFLDRYHASLQLDPAARMAAQKSIVRDVNKAVRAAVAAAEEDSAANSDPLLSLPPTIKPQPSAIPIQDLTRPNATTVHAGATP